ncbi:MAG: EAL domain-containing protein [Gammaproteobacteria bacterium]
MVDQATVLIVDDQEINREILEAMLSSENYRLLFAASGAEALKILDDNTVDVLLLDVMMPGMDGYEVCRRIRATAALADLPVVMVTALDDRRSRLHGIDVGADDFIIKPVDKDELRARVRGITRLNRYRRLLEQSQRLAYLEAYDPVTDLPNRQLLTAKLGHNLQQAALHKNYVAVYCIGFDVRMVNFAFGVEFSERLLRMIADRLSHDVTSDITVARFSDDRFVIVRSFEPSIHEVDLFGQRISALLRRPFPIGEQELRVSSSTGICVFPPDGHKPETLLANAAIAMERARQQSRGGYQFFAAEMNATAVERITLEAELQRALDNHELRLFYQPKIDLNSDAMIGLEALLRWQHPQRGLLTPTHFIGIAEETGLIEPVGEWVLREACRQIKRWRGQDLFPGIRVAVNVSSTQFHRHDLAKTMRQILEESGIEGDALELELTESVLMPDRRDDNHDVLATLEELKALGLHLSIDDFGVGYSSLDYLRRFPVDSLKIDRSFISGLPVNNDVALATTIIDLAHNLKLKVIAEGVETQAETEFLRSRNCDQGQGYLYAYPMPPELLETWWHERNRD